MTEETFGNYFRAACNSAGVLKLAHGVRKISATRAANAGATVAELKALFGWTDDVIRHFIGGVQTAFGLPRKRSQNCKNRTNYKLLCSRLKNNSIKTISYTVKNGNGAQKTPHTQQKTTISHCFFYCIFYRFVFGVPIEPIKVSHGTNHITKPY
ncbi:hypothetical protein [Bartonella choladocola]|uniref:hypothetical protein n=1 Tax=Bartonella choladocola TaxID=2750995 RepID=UPI003B52D095